MRNEILMYLEKDEDYFIFLRENPNWHKLLSRNINEYNRFIEEYKIKRRKRIIDKIEDVSMLISLAKELM
jgi:hypothetical protein